MAKRSKRTSGYLAGELADDPAPKRNRRAPRQVTIQGDGGEAVAAAGPTVVAADDIVWVAFHKDAFHLLGTRTEQGLRLTIKPKNEQKWPNGLTTVELDIKVEDDGMVMVPRVATPSNGPTSLLDRIRRGN